MATSDTVTVASKVPFSELCRLLDKLDNLTNKKRGKVSNPTQIRKNHLRTFIDTWRSTHDKLHPSGTATKDSFFPAMRLLLPHLEKEREAYGIKENTLAKLYIEVLSIDKKSPDAKMLLEYNAPKTASLGSDGDFASTAYYVLKSRCPEKGTLTVQDVNDCLDSIASNNTSGQKDAVRSSILKLLKNLSAGEQKWLIRMIMKELRCGVSQATIFSVFHPDAEDLFNVTNSLETVCLVLNDPEDRSTEIAISLFSAFKLMLGDRGKPSEVEELMKGGEYFIETKFDGERFQIHKNGDEYRYFSRGGYDYTAVFGKDPYSGTLTPFIHNCFLSDVRNCILDGEMMGYDPDTKMLGSKGENFDIKSKDVYANVGYQPCYVVFDALYYNDKLLTGLPLKERTEYMNDKMVKPCPGRITLSERKIAKTKEECADALNAAIDNRDEGIMIKNAESVYKANTRKGGWFKIKPDHIEGLMDELDILIVGGYFGSSVSNMLTHFMLAMAEPAEDGGHPKRFHSFCKVGTGYTRRELFSLNRRLIDHWKKYDKKDPPECLVLADGQKERPDVWIEPSQSVIVQVKASELVASGSFKTGCTARFPRVTKIRSDKDKAWHECMTTAELESLRSKSFNKLTNRYDLDGEAAPAKKRRVLATSKPTVSTHYRGVDRSLVEKTGEIFLGKTFCVLQGTPEYPKAELEKKVLEYGGEITQNPDQNTTCIVTSKNTGLKIANFTKSGKYDIVKADWLVRCVSKRRNIPWNPTDLWHALPATKVRFSSQYDSYGDSYTEPTDLDELKNVFQNIEEKKCTKLISPTRIADLEYEFFPDESPLGLFRTCRFYVDDKNVLGDETTKKADSVLALIGLEARLRGATITQTLDDRVSHVIVDESDLSRLSLIRDEARSRERRFHIVKPSWIERCIFEGQLVTERFHEPS